MIDFSRWFGHIFDPQKTNLREGAFEDILAALDNPTVRRMYVEGLLNEIWESNIRLDRLMEKEQDTEWKKISIRRNAIVFCLNQVLTTKESLESELVEQERQDRLLATYQGAAAPLDNRR